MLQQVLELEGERVWTAASGFGGGIGREQYVCGAVAGAVIALGLYGGKTVQDSKEIGNTIRPTVKAFARGFADTFGSVECGALVPFDFKAEGGYEAFRASDTKQRFCHRYVRYAVETVAGLKSEGKLPGAKS